MAGKVFFSVSMSLDGFIAPESLEDLMGQQWMELQQWIFPQRFFRENLKLGEGGEEGRDNDIVRETFERTGASVMGKRMFDAGERAWPEEAPFHTPVFVVTHEKRDSWPRPGGTTFHFVNDGIEPALDQAREAAGDRDVRVVGGLLAVAPRNAEFFPEPLGEEGGRQEPTDRSQHPAQRSAEPAEGCDDEGQVGDRGQIGASEVVHLDLGDAVVPVAREPLEV